VTVCWRGRKGWKDEAGAKVSLLKMDFRGLRTLTLLDICQNNAKCTI